MSVLSEKPTDESTLVDVQSSANADGSSSRDERLQAARRLDWRFLLPDAQLKRVAYFGSATTCLSNSLERFSESLAVFTTASNARISNEFDIVVLDSDVPHRLPSAAAILPEGSWLYWEIDRRSWLKRLQFRHVESYVTKLERLGFQQIQVHWHRPEFETCLEIIPLQDRHALEHVFARRIARLIKSSQLAFGRLLLRTGLLSRLVPCVSLTARMGVRLASFNGKPINEP